jgi:dihydrofolate reductase
MKLALHTFLTLDGVLQAPGGSDEDVEGAFEYGGWSYPFSDEDFGAAVTNWFANADAFLLGRKTYQIFAGYWPQVTDPQNPVASKLNALPKYVASKTLNSAEWTNSTIITDVVSEVTKLKEQPGNEIQVHGSGALAATLIDNDLVDEYRLLTFPVHLGQGKKLFREGGRAASLRLVSSSTTIAGVVISTYVPDGDVRTGTFTVEEESA